MIRVTGKEEFIDFFGWERYTIRMLDFYTRQSFADNRNP